MRLLFLGGAYGSILATKCALAGHKVDIVCRAQEAANINSGNLVIHFAGDAARSVGISGCQTNMRGISVRHVEPSGYDICFLCMQEPQFAEGHHCVCTITTGIAVHPAYLADEYAITTIPAGAAGY